MTTKQHEMSRRQRHPVPAHLPYAEHQRALKAILTKRRKRQAVKASRWANR